jgi:hypothetical protein
MLKSTKPLQNLQILFLAWEVGLVAEVPVGLGFGK